MDGSSPRDVAKQVLEIEAQAILDVIPQLDEGFERAVDLMANCRGRVVCTGMGKSGLVLQKVVATLASTGTPSMFLHPAEAIHGDLGMIIEGDVVLAASNSGTTEELLRLVETLKRLGVPLIAITGKPASPLARLADVSLSVAIQQEACPLNLAPTASTSATLALGDALAMAVMQQRGFTDRDFARLHPGGQLGKRLLEVSQLMHRDERLPRIVHTALMREAVFEMSNKGLGITAVIDEEGRLVGAISDGDLRRLLEVHDDLLTRRAADCMNPRPQTIAADVLASAALHKMEEKRITSLFVCDPARHLDGIVHLHDLWRLELF
ncbi:MAG: KpsF/GutQ family sugar-phosphate isomerase [Thermoanaerobaculia bacterium]|nr:KpsF/GutQ family sugar-phosphate isomerase [Thermoanaerobaculia bacterium]